MKKILLILFCLQFSVFVYGQKIFYANGSGEKKQIALTFDDGPGKNTESVLTILKDNGVKATFFLSGTSVKNNPKSVKKMYNQGHEIANHTYNHVNFFRYKGNDADRKIREELLSCERLISSIIPDYKTKIVRFPNGFSRKLAVKTAKENGYIIVNWSFGCDWDKKIPQEKLLKEYTEHIKSGAIFLMHDLADNKKIINILPQFIAKIREEGYELVTVSDLLNIKQGGNK